MGTSLASIHILDGDKSQIDGMLPKAVIGQWSDRFLSVYSEDFNEISKSTERLAKSLSKKMPQPVLLAWIFDSDDVGFHVYQDGKKIVEHIAIVHAGNYFKMGNVPLFCEILGLPSEDKKRLRVVWKKANAEEKLFLTASLLGVPLGYDSKYLPDKFIMRDSDVVDKWISEHPAPPKVNNATKAEIMQEMSFYSIYSYGNVYFGSNLLDPNDCWSPRNRSLLTMNENGMLCIYKDLGVDESHSYIIYPGEEKLVEEANSLENTINMSEYTFSPDGKYKYRFRLTDNVTIINTETQAIENEVAKSTMMIPCGFDDIDRIWVMRSESTIEAWDMMLTKTLSRHKLKGCIIGTHKNAHGDICVVTESEKAGAVYVYKIS